MTDFNIKEALAEDIPLIINFIKELAEYEKLSHEVVVTKELLQENLFGERPFAKALIAYSDNNPVGFALYFYNFSTFLGKPGIYLEDLYVKPAYRGKGFGKALLVALAQIAKHENCSRLEWAVLDWNTPSIEFYKSLGARLMNEWKVCRLDDKGIYSLASDHQK